MISSNFRCAILVGKNYLDFLMVFDSLVIKTRAAQIRTYHVIDSLFTHENRRFEPECYRHFWQMYISVKLRFNVKKMKFFKNFLIPKMLLHMLAAQPILPMKLILCIISRLYILILILS